MWGAIYYVAGFILLGIIGVGSFVAYSMITQLLNYLESKRETRLTKEDLGIKVTMHRPDNLKRLMKEFRVDDFRRVRRSDRIKSNTNSDSGDL